MAKQNYSYSDIIEDIDKNKPDRNPDPNAIEAMQSKDGEVTQNVNYQPQKKESDRILESIWNSAAPPNPEYNEKLQNRRKKVAKLNAAGQGFNVLGDILSLTTGANVQRRQPDQTTPAMLQSYQGYIQNYDDKMDNYRYRKYRDNLANKKLLYQDALRDERYQRSDERYQDSQDWREKQFEAQQERYKESRPWITAGFKNKEDWQKWEAENREREARFRDSRSRYYDGLTEERARTPEGGSGNAHIILLNSGKQKELTEAQFSYLRNEAMRNAELLAEKYPHLFETEEIEGEFNLESGKRESEYKYTPKRSADDEDFVRAYIELMEGQKNSMPEGWTNRTGMELDQQTPQRSKQDKTEGIDYSNINY